MLLLNFSHPITPSQQVQIEELSGEVATEIRDIPTQFDNEKPFAEQVRMLAEATGLTPIEWQTEAILINPPAYNFAAVTLLSELHGRMGYLPAIIRIRPVEDDLLVRYEVAEIINLQSVRESARMAR